MRNGLVGVASALAIASTMATGGCSSTSSGGADGGTTSSSGGGSGSCGEADGGVTTLCGTMTLGALTTAQATQLCDDTFTYFARAISKSTWCTWQGLKLAANSSPPSDMQAQTDCTNGENMCNQADAGPAPSCNSIPTPCTATVAQYSQCITDEVAALIQTVNQLPTCPTIKQSDTGTIQTDVGACSPASCATLMSGCSGIYPPDPLTLM